jgi:hypothetical protein
MRTAQLVLAVALGGLANSPSVARAAFINFDAIDASTSPEGVGGTVLANYLAGFGASVVPLNPNTQVVVYDVRTIYAGLNPVVAPSPYNVIGTTGVLDPVSFLFIPESALDSLTFTRPFIYSGATGIALPEWRATAYDQAGNVLGSVGENARSAFSNVQAQTFTLQGPGITSIRFDHNNYRFAAFASMPLDDFVLQPSPVAVPEPASVVLFTAGAVGLLGLVRWRRRPGTSDAGAGTEPVCVAGSC